MSVVCLASFTHGSRSSVKLQVDDVSNSDTYSSNNNAISSTTYQCPADTPKRQVKQTKPPHLSMNLMRNSGRRSWSRRYLNNCTDVSLLKQKRRGGVGGAVAARRGFLNPGAHTGNRAVSGADWGTSKLESAQLFHQSIAERVVHPWLPEGPIRDLDCPPPDHELRLHLWIVPIGATNDMLYHLSTSGFRAVGWCMIGNP